MKRFLLIPAMATLAVLGLVAFKNPVPTLKVTVRCNDFEDWKQHVLTEDTELLNVLCPNGSWAAKAIDSSTGTLELRGMDADKIWFLECSNSALNAYEGATYTFQWME